jgi:superfamily II DNA or RNA helicase
VLIADEVGLGKTVEVGLLIKGWLERSDRLRVLYLAPARLVNNVRWEFDRLGLGFRQWSASVEIDGRLDDPRLIASIHRAVHAKHFETLINAPRWDAVIVDECHHLSDWAPGGGDPTRKFKLVRELIAKQGPDARVVFLSGTPHQGNMSRFENLLKLLKHDDEPDGAMAGRVIYRTKEDVRGWDGEPLFPGRKVAKPLVVDLGPEYREWIEQIHDFFAPPKAGSPMSEPRRRSANWRCAQALQWAASSLQAGLGYLVRQAVRAGWTPSKRRVLAEALLALRPYRMGPTDEPVDVLFDRIRKEIDRQKQAADIEDIEDSVDYSLDPDYPTLDSLLGDGIRLLRSSHDDKWSILADRILNPAGDEKIVLFAQPVETVTALAGYLERTTGVRPALIVGGQDDATRQREIDSFRKADGPRYLVSSRAGGEGINLQVSRRLVHLDVPWNPMDMEQRVGRVHRFGSRQTILVDTLVVKNSREEAAYRVARERLANIAHMLVDPEKFETLFSRVMSLIPPEEFIGVMVHRPGEGLSDDQEKKLAEMVRLGYQSWSDFSHRFAAQQRAIRGLSPGLATWDDLRRFLVEQAGCVRVEGFRALRFAQPDSAGEPVAFERSVPVVRHPDGTHYVGQEHDGMPVSRRDGVKVEALGLNVPIVAEALRKVALSIVPTGAAHLRWSETRPRAPVAATFGVLVLLRQALRSEGSRWVEHGLELHCYHVAESGVWSEWIEGDRNAAICGLLKAIVRRDPHPDGPLLDILVKCEAERIHALRMPTDDDRARNMRHTVLPLLAAVISP